MRLRIVSVNGIDVKETKTDNDNDNDNDNDAVTVRFSQTTPARVVLVENAASVFHFNDNYFAAQSAPSATTAPTTSPVTADTTAPKTTENTDAELAAWENSLILMHRNVALLHHDMHQRERYIVERFGPNASPIVAHVRKHAFGKGKSDGPCSEITAFLGSVFHKVAGTAKSLYGDLVSNAFGEDEPHHHGPHGFHTGPHDGPHGGPHDGPRHFNPFHDRSGFPVKAFCFPNSGRMGPPPPPPPPPPPSFLFHCPPLPPSHEELSSASRAGFAGSSFPPKHPHGSSLPNEGPHHDMHHDGHHDGHHDSHHGGPPDGGPFWMAGVVAAPIDKAGEFRGRKMHGHGPDGPPPPETWIRGHHGHGPRHGPSLVKMAAFFALVVVVLFVFARHCSNRRIEKHLRNRRANRPRGFRGFAARFHELSEEVQGRHARRQARRERRRQRRASRTSFFRSVRRFFFARDDDDEKLLAAEAGAAPSAERTGHRSGITEGHIVTNTPTSRERSPAPSLEDEIAQFRVAADVVGQMIAAEEGRLANAQTAESRRQEDEDLERVMRATATSPASPPSPPPTALAAPPYNQPPPPPPPPPSMANSASVYGGYGSYSRRDVAGIDSDFDDTESLPPAYSPDDYQYVNLVEASVVADGFQYRPGSSP